MIKIFNQTSDNVFTYYCEHGTKKRII